ncbi:MAG: prepilin peptidase [Deltaproteobacteria bacterium]
MIIGLALKIIIAVILVFISYKDIKERIIPNWAVAVVLCLSTVWYFLYSRDIKDYFFYIFLLSMPLLILSFILDSLSDIKHSVYGYVVILISVVTAVLIPADSRTKYITACLIILLLTLLEGLFNKKQEEEEEGLSIGGGDIKLIAGLGPVLQMNGVVFLFISFLTAYIYMKIKREKDICLAPFMLIGYLVMLFI